MTQTINPNRQTAFDQLILALEDARQINETGGLLSRINGQRTASYGALIKIDAEHKPGDATGPAHAVRWATYCAPGDAPRVLDRMTAEGRTIHAVTALRGALGGTTRS